MAPYTPVADFLAPPSTDKDQSPLEKVVIEHLSDRTKWEEFMRLGFMRLQVTPDVYEYLP